MRRNLAVIALLFSLCALVGALSSQAAAVVGSWNGWITDDLCKEKGATDPEHQKCAMKCVGEKGASFVLFNTGDKKTYKLDRQDLAKQHLGHEVTITGKVDGNMIMVDSIIKKTPK